MENLNVNQEMNFDEMAEVVGGDSCGDLVEFYWALVDANAPGGMILDAFEGVMQVCSQ
jgi:hypothetical protein